MESCPFCGGEVHEDLIIFGGPCPHCFLEIPGEEAPTNPGEAVKAQIEQADQAEAKRRRLVPLLIGGLSLACVMAALAFVAFRPEPEVARLNFDDDYLMADLDELPTYEAPVADGEGEAETVTRQGTRTQTGTRSGSGSQSGTDALERLRNARQIQVGEGEIASIQGSEQERAEGMRTGTRTSQIEGDDGELGIGEMGTIQIEQSQASLTPIQLTRQRQRGITLTDDNQVIDMLRDIMSLEASKLKSQCYERSLKSNEDLRGRWKLLFTVNKKGKTKDISVQGLTMDDADFESCIVNQIQRWEFQPIYREQPLQKTYTFRPS